MKKGTILITIGLLLIAAALCLTGYNLWDDYRAKSASGDVMEQLEQLIPQILEVPEEAAQVFTPPVLQNPDEIEYPDYLLNPHVTLPVETIMGIDYIGVLQIPRLGLKLPIINQFNMERLRVSPCRFTGSPYQNNFVICAHNYDCHFGRLKNLNMGDKLTFTDIDNNVFTYRVLELEILEPDDVEDMIDTVYWDMTLFTCTLGGASRVTVRCVLDE